VDPILLKCLIFLYHKEPQVQRDLLDQRVLPDLQDLVGLQDQREAMVQMEVTGLRAQQRDSAHQPLQLDP
jgi:hypothetical protein